MNQLVNLHWQIEDTHRCIIVAIMIIGIICLNIYVRRLDLKDLESPWENGPDVSDDDVIARQLLPKEKAP